MNKYNYRRVHELHRVSAVVALFTALSHLEYTQWHQGQQHHMGVKGVRILQVQPLLRVSSEGCLRQPLGNDRVIYNECWDAAAHFVQGMDPIPPQLQG